MQLWTYLESLAIFEELDDLSTALLIYTSLSMKYERNAIFDTYNTSITLIIDILRVLI